ncbi:GntR family transcriptional regulator [Rubrivivax gelatinosus]|uniref:GntR family transcriptional regulator n=1 Tax=Rubrivivax gelatinosus TaxID=28068 RepID=UPI00190409F6|nr:GntR family transcriptional regulator [Rubrivivax gelatinosus]MBK1615918.1 GntR family transcriptional regulator [Rubrivivax gelatinosus]
MPSNPSRLALVQPEPGQSRYAALAAALRQRVVDGEWPPGTALPAETSLAAEHGVALGTLRRALELLAEQGLIERRHGRGTFVRGGISGAPMLRFFRFGEGDGELPQSRILSRQQVLASAEVARRLGVARGDPVLRLHRLRSLGGQPRLFEEIWLPLPLFEALATLPAADWGSLLYPFFVERCGVAVARVSDEIGFAPLAAAHARWLELAAGHPGVAVTRQAYDLAGRCVELRVTHGDAYAFHYSVTIT